MRVRKLYNDGGEIASTILQQLGGANRLHAMTGAYNFVNLGNGLSFKIKNQRANYIKITLTSMDLYDVEVGRIRGNTYKVVAEGNGMYAEELKRFIEKSTGMYLTLGRGFAKGGMISVKSEDGEDLMYKIDTDEKYIEVDENTKKYLSDIALVMDRNFRKLKDTYIFWYDDMSDSDITELEEVFQTSLNMFAKGGYMAKSGIFLYDENDKDKGYVIKKDDEYWVGNHWNWHNSEKYKTKKLAEENLKTIKYLTINRQDMFDNFDDGLTKKDVLEFINISKNINKKYWIKDSTGYSKYLYKGQLRNNDSVEGIFTASKIGADRLNDSYKYKIQVDELYPKELIDIQNLDANQNLKEKPISIANKDWKKYIKDNSSFSVDEETENKIVLATRENGSVGDEQHSSKDIQRAKDIYKKIKNKYPNTKGRIYTVDEWVFLELEAPQKMAEGGELEDDTFVMLFKGYGFVEKRGSYGTRTFYNIEHNAKIYYDPKYRSISGYVGGGEGNDEVIPYSVNGVLDFFIEHDITESEATPMAKGGNVWDEDLNVYTLVSSKEYFGSDTASDKRRWFRRNGRGLSREQAKRMAQDYIDRYGKERVYIGNIRHYR